jgi:hypothetical protein
MRFSGRMPLRSLIARAAECARYSEIHVYRHNGSRIWGRLRRKAGALSFQTSGAGMHCGGKRW